MKKSSKTTTTALAQPLNQRRANTLRRTTNSLADARRAIERAIEQAGCAITIDPSSAPDLADHLTVTTVSGLEGATLGAGLGALLGLLFDEPAAGLTIGASIGLLVGANRGVERVQAGWRVRAVRELDELPRITTIKAIKPR